MKQKNMLSFSGNAVVLNTFLLPCFFYSSLTCIVLKSFIDRCFGFCGCNGIYNASFSLRWVLPVLLPFCLQSKKLVTAATLILPLANLDPTSYPAPCKPISLNPPLILLMSKWHCCPYIKHQVWITLRAESPDIQMRPKFMKMACKYKLIMLAS